MVDNSIALRAEGLDFGNSFGRGAAMGQDRALNSMRMDMAQREEGREQALQMMQMLGSAGMYAMGGQMDGEVDPAKWDEAMDGLAQFGFDSAKYKGQPQLAAALVGTSLSTSDRIKMAQDDREFNLALQKFDADLAQNAASLGLRREELNLAKQRVADGGTETGLAVSYGRDADGNLIALQATKDGQLVQSRMPEGVALDLGVKSEEGEAGKKRGAGRGEAQVALPGAAATAARVSKQIESLQNDPYLPSMVGSVDSRLPNVSSDAARVQSKMDQLQGGAFLEARQLLKGGGAITDFEGNKAEQAFVRMNAAQNETDFKEALGEFNDAVTEGVRKLEEQAKGGAAASPAVEDPLGIR